MKQVCCGGLRSCLRARVAGLVAKVRRSTRRFEVELRYWIREVNYAHVETPKCARAVLTVVQRPVEANSHNGGRKATSWMVRDSENGSRSGVRAGDVRGPRRAARQTPDHARRHSASGRRPRSAVLAGRPAGRL